MILLRVLQEAETYIHISVITFNNSSPRLTPEAVCETGR